MRHIKTSSAKDPIHRIMLVEHLSSNHFTIVITVAKTFQLSPFVHRLNEMRDWSPNRKFTNYALYWFVVNFGERLFNRCEFKVTQLGAFESITAAKHKARQVALSRGTDKLIGTGIVHNDEWSLHRIAKAKLNIALKKDQFQPVPVTQLERQGSLSIFTGSLDEGTALWQILAVHTADFGERLTITENPETVYKECQDEKHYAVGVIHLGAVNYIHFASSVGTMMATMPQLLEQALNRNA